MDTEQLKSAVNLAELAEQYTTLKRCAVSEWAGPCPKCGGTDRFHVHDSGWFFCRQCWPFDNGEAHDTIGFLQWVEGLDFRSACERLSSGSADPVPPRLSPPPPPRRTRSAPPGEWQQRVKAIVEQAHECLLTLPAGLPGRQYLEGRGLLRSTWTAFKLGYLVRTDGAFIALPWQQSSMVFALRLRRLAGEGDKLSKLLSKKDSQFADRLFGLSHLQGADRLLLVEGEFNCLSVWQVSRSAGLALDVVSFGHGQGLAAAAIELGKKYQHVYTWHDKEVHARAARRRLQAAGVHPRTFITGGQGKDDANELLQQGRLLASLKGMIE